MPFQPAPRPLPVLAGALAFVGIMLALTDCSNHAPAVAQASVSRLTAPITLQVVRFQPAPPTGKCPPQTVNLYGLALGVPWAAPASAQPVGQDTPSTPAATSRLPVGVACYRPIGSIVTIPSAAVSPVSTYPAPSGMPDVPATYGFVVTFSTADVPQVTAIIRQAHDAGDAVGLIVASKLWEAPKAGSAISGRGVQIALASKSQAVQLHGLLVASG